MLEGCRKSVGLVLEPELEGYKKVLEGCMGAVGLVLELEGCKKG